MTPVAEEGAEAVLDLQRAYTRERALRKELTLVLDAMQALAGASDVDEVFRRFMQALRALLNARGAAILECRKGTLVAVAHTKEVLAGEWTAGPVFKRVLAGRAAPVFDTSRLQEWRGRPGGPHHAALLVPMTTHAMRGMLICTHPERGFFTRAHVEKAKSLVPIAAQALERIHAIEMARREEAANLANEAKSRFLANMSHELRTPLTAILGYVELITEEMEGHQQALADLHNVEVASRHLLSLINELLDLAKIESGKEAVDLADVDLREVVVSLERTVRPLIVKGGNRLIVECPRAVPMLRTDGLRLRQVLLNLLSNAAKFTSGGEVAMRVRLDGQGVTIAVSDTGIGIPAHLLPKMFEAFEQMAPAAPALQEGTGLGLPICKKLVDLLGGTLDADSEVGVGSTFRVHLPLT